MASALKRRDKRLTSSAVQYAANSNFVRSRIERAWAQPAEVIYPPVAVERIQEINNWSGSLSNTDRETLEALPSDFVLGASRLVEYKRLDMPIKVGSLLDLPVVIAGDGPFRSQLVDQAEKTDTPVTFLGRVSDELLYALYQRSVLFVFMAVEDFGIMPVEAMAAGTPVLANAVGGGAESVRLAQGGSVVPQSASAAELREAALLAIAIDKKMMLDQVRQFGETQFQSRIRSWIGDNQEVSQQVGQHER
nr:glycosyltransferase [Aeromicrobium stalagmiti]